MKTYTEKKAAAREEAINLMEDLNENPSWGYSAAIYEHLEKQARRYGLLEEFRENGIL